MELTQEEPATVVPLMNLIWSQRKSLKGLGHLKTTVIEDSNAYLIHMQCAVIEKFQAKENFSKLLRLPRRDHLINMVMINLFLMT